MIVAVSGSTGFLGSALVSALDAAGHTVRRLSRSVARTSPEDIPWDPATGRIEGVAMEGLDAVIHLAGENLATGRWTAAKKESIRQSRVGGTRLIAETLGRAGRPPPVLVAASAVGYYGDRGDEVLTEESPVGAGFLASVCREWEAATMPAVERGIRVINLRLGVVLGRGGGILRRLVPTFRMGGGGVIGGGRQYMSWISVDDVVGAVLYLLDDRGLRGPVNAVAPAPVTNAEFTKTLGRLLSRPTLFRIPAFAARVALGEMADELLLASARVIPARLLASGYAFRHPGLAEALRAALS